MPMRDVSLERHDRANACLKAAVQVLRRRLWYLNGIAIAHQYPFLAIAALGETEMRVECTKSNDTCDNAVE